MIFVPKLKIIEPNTEIISRSGMAGEFRLVATNRYTGRQRVLADWFPNLITDGGIDRPGVANNWMAGCYVGSGNTAPNVTDTSLQTLVASTTNRTSNTTSSSGSAPWYAQQSITYRFAQGAAAGNLQEIGVGWSSSTLFSRALILDSLGDPTTITVLADEFLDATYRLRNYAPPSDVITEMTIDGIETEVIARARDANSQFGWLTNNYTGPRAGGDPVSSASRHNVYSGVIGAVTGSPAGTTATGPGAANAAYSSGSLFRDYSTTWGLTQGNVGSVRSYGTYMGGDNGGFGRMQYQFTPAIAKDNTKTMVLHCRHIWGRYTA